MQSRSRTETVPQTLAQVGLGEAAEGFALNVGSGAGQLNRIYQVNVTAEAGGSTTEIEVRLSRTEADAVGY